MNSRAVLLGLAPVLGAARLVAQEPYPLHPDTLDGVWQGYDGEWRHVSNQLMALAEAIPAEKYRFEVWTLSRSVDQERDDTGGAAQSLHRGTPLGLSLQHPASANVPKSPPRIFRWLWG
jgi:hypothetical protein